MMPADSGELQKVSALLGIAHPPGYALYTMIAHVFTLIPLENLAWRTNSFSALTAAATLALVCMTVQRAGKDRAGIGGIVAALNLGAVPTFWMVATSASVRPLTALFAAGFAFTVVSFGSTR